MYLARFILATRRLWYARVRAPPAACRVRFWVWVEARLVSASACVACCVFRNRDPDNAGVDTAEAIRRMKQARSRAKKGGGVKEVKTLAALQQELKVRTEDVPTTRFRRSGRAGKYALV